MIRLLEEFIEIVILMIFYIVVGVYAVLLLTAKGVMLAVREIRGRS